MKIRFLFLSLLFSLPAVAAPYTSLEIRDWGDALFGAPDQPEELNDPALSAVTREFGPTVIPMRELPIESPLATASSTPWSSWWFPKIDRDLFFDGSGTSPLEKYDIVRASLTGKPSLAAKFEADHYSGSGPHWEGLCDAWAIAATLYPEPAAPRTIKLANGTLVSFSVSDLKALLLKTVDSLGPENFKLYGQKFTGNQDGWIFPDIFPQELHRYVEKQIFERHRMFVMDHDPGVEVWSEPVYKANYKITAVPGRSDAVFVKLWLYTATSYTQKELKDKTGIHELVRAYNYYLYGKPDGAGNLVVSSGVWVKGDLVDSRRDHPDFVYHVAEPASVKRRSQNPEIDPAVVDRILGRQKNGVSDE